MKKLLILLTILLLFLSQSESKVVNGTEGVVNLAIIPENQTKFIDEVGEYEINITILDIGLNMECNLDGQNFIFLGKSGNYQKTINNKIYFEGKRIVNFSHNLYCKCYSGSEILVWNITKSGKVSFIPYPINFSTEFFDEIKIDCENPEKIVKLVVKNTGKDSIACYYEKIFNNKSEKISIPSPIKYGEVSQSHLNFSIAEIPASMITDVITNFSLKVKIYCYDAYNNVLIKEENLPVIANLTVRKKIMECEKKINEIRKNDVDVEDIENNLNKAKKYENLKACSASEIYAERCLMLANEKENLIKQNKQKEELIKAKKKNATDKINELKNKILELNYTKSEKAMSFINNANSMLLIAQDKFLNGDYDSAIIASQQGIESINYAIKIIEKEKEEERENLTKNVKNETQQVEKNYTEEKIKENEEVKKSNDLLLIVLIVIVVSIVVIIIKYIQYLKQTRSKK